MSNNFSTVGLTFDGTDLQRDDLSLTLDITKGLNDIPTVRGEDTVVPHMTGRLQRSRVADRRQITLEGWIMGVGATDADQQADFRQTIRGIVALFDPATDASVLSALLEDGATATINARPNPPMLVEEVIRGRVARVNVELESIDPYWVITEPGS